MGSISSEFLNYGEVKSNMLALNQIFSDYWTILKSIDEVIDSNINVGDESALDSVLGTNFLSSWNSNAASFNDFKKEFDSLYAKVTKFTSNTEKFEDRAVALTAESYKEES